MEWYEGYKHLGYDVKGQKIVKPEGRDKLEEFLNKVDNPDYWYATSIAHHTFIPVSFCFQAIFQKT